MDKVYSFSPYKGVTAKDNGQTIFLHGDTVILSKIKDFLTVEDGSLKWGIRSLEKKIKKVKESSYVTAGLLEELESELAKNKAMLLIHYYKDVSENIIQVPRGLWWFAENNVCKTDLKFCEFPDNELGIKPRDYQTQSVEELIKLDRGMIELATGLGKTIVLAYLTHILKQNHGEDFRVMIVVPNVALQEQTLAFLKNFFPDATSIGGGKKFKNGTTMIVGVVNSCIQYSDRFDAIIIDEVHHSASDMYCDLVGNARKAKYVWGLTATPTRADGMILGVHSNVGPVLFRRNTQWGVDNGYLSPATFYMANFSHVKKYYSNIAEAKAYSYIVTSPHVVKECVKFIYHMLSKGRTILFLTKHVKPSQKLAELVGNALGMTIEVAHGKYKKPLKDFKDGKIQVLFANDDLCGEGVDIPNVDCMFNLTQRSSESKIRQILGRGLRRSEGKEQLIFFDFVLSGYGEYRKNQSGDNKWVDQYANAARKRKGVYNEIGRVTEYNVSV